MMHGSPMLPCEACPLRSLPDIRDFSPDQLAWISRQKRTELRHAAGETIIPEGAKDERFYTLLRGWAFRYKSLPDGRRQILNILLPGDLVGLQAELMNASPHGIEVLTEVSLCGFRRDMMWELFRDHPPMALDLTWLAAHGERLTDDVLMSVGQRSGLERMAMLLVHIYRRAVSSGLKRADGAVPFPLTQQHIADVLGLSAVHTNRVLQVLRKQGLITLKEGALAIGDLRALRRVAEYWEQPAPARPIL